MKGRRTPEEVTISRLVSYVIRNADVLTPYEMGVLHEAIGMIEAISPDLRRAGR